MKDKNQISLFVKIIVVVFSFSILFVVFLGAMMLRAENELELSDQNRLNSHIVADDMYQSSEDLTRFVRMYAATGNVYYKDIYFDVLNIRNGVIARPVNYGNLYWNLKLPKEERVTEPGAKLSLSQRLIDTGFTDEELALLYEAERESNQLVATEMIAMRAMEDALTPDEKLLMLPGETNQQFAIRILNDKAYLDSKERIMEPIEQFYDDFTARTDQAVAIKTRETTMLTHLLGTYLGIVLIVMTILVRKVIRLSKENEAVLEDRIRIRTKELLKFSKGIEQSPATIVIANTAGTMEYVNPQFTKITGYTAEEAIGQNPRILKSGLTPASVYQDLWTTILSGREWAGEFCNKKKTGELFWERVHISPIKDDNGEIINFIAIKEDITEQRHLNEQLKQSEEKFRIIADYSLDWEAWFSPEGKLLWTCPACYKLSGYTVSECFEYPDFPIMVFVDEEQENVKELFQQAISGSTEHNKLLRVKKKNGEVFWSAVSWQPVYDDEGNFFGTRTSLRDISDRIQAEDDLKLALNKVEALYKTSLSLSNTIDIAKVFEIILTKLNEVIPYNSAAIQEYKNNQFTILQCVGLKNKSEILGISFTAQEGSIGGIVCKTKKSLIIPDVKKVEDYVDLSEGKVVRSLMAVPLILNGKIAGVLTLDSIEENYFTDEMATTATAFASLAAIALSNSNNLKELIIAKEEAEAATKAKGDFLANMSHEIRTPMNAVIGFTNLLEETELKTKQRDYINKIKMSTQNLLVIINDILDYSKIESGKMSIENINFKLEDVLDNLSNIVSSKAYNKGIEYVVIMDKSVPNHLVGDPFRIGQVLLNLVNNAIKFTEKGEVIVRISSKSMEEESAMLEFSVEDSGIGMTKEQVSKLFQAFSQADVSTTRKYGGTGLGLSISKNLASMMDGSIRVQSEFGVGSKFVFTVKVTKRRESRSKVEVIPAFVSKLKVLLVVGNDYTRELLRSYLEGFYYNPDLAATGEEAIEITKSKKYDLIIMDYRMSGINGIETWRQIQKEPAEGTAPVCFLITAYVIEKIRDEAMQAGIKDILPKPISQSTLFDTIVRLFSNETVARVMSTMQDDRPNGFEAIRGAHILLVEDNEINQQVAKELLELEGFWVDVAENGRAAINNILQKQYDVVLMDLQMPVMDGYEATKLLRAEYKFTDLPIIALSADAMSGTKSATRKAGMNDYISKPIEKKELFLKLVKWITPGERERNVAKDSADFAVTREDLEKYLKMLT